MPCGSGSTQTKIDKKRLKTHVISFNGLWVQTGYSGDHIPKMTNLILNQKNQDDGFDSSISSLCSLFYEYVSNYTVLLTEQTITQSFFFFLLLIDARKLQNVL